jgi:hypothetical protein
VVSGGSAISDGGSGRKRHFDGWAAQRPTWEELGSVSHCFGDSKRKKLREKRGLTGVTMDLENRGAVELPVTVKMGMKGGCRFL